MKCSKCGRKHTLRWHHLCDECYGEPPEAMTVLAGLLGGGVFGGVVGGGIGATIGAILGAIFTLTKIYHDKWRRRWRDL